MIAVTAKGFIIGLGLVSPFGMQNTWVLNQGIRRNRHLLVAGICALCDVLLISVGINAHTAFAAIGGDFARILTLLAMWFLAGYSAYLIYGVCRTMRSTDNDPGTPTGTSTGFWMVVFGTLLVTLLNPHVLAERIIILGAISTDVAVDARLAFAAGAISASFVWFFFLSSAAAKLNVFLTRRRTRLALDTTIAVVLTGFTIYLFRGLYMPDSSAISF